MLAKTKEMFLDRVRNLREFAGFLAPGEEIQEVFNEEGRLHSEVGPAYRSATRIKWYRNGQQHGLDADIFGSMTYYWKGVLIPDHYYIRRESLSLEDILSHPNTEVRSVGLEIYGYDRMERDGDFKVIHADRKKEMVLYRFESGSLHEPLVILRVKNSTAERDGTFRPYFLCVPPTIKTCLEAVAWTFNKSPQDYCPSVET